MTIDTIVATDVQGKTIPLLLNKRRQKFRVSRYYELL